jgi:hypothetical protein
MKKRIKPKISIFCFGSLLLITPVLLATSCTSNVTPPVVTTVTTIKPAAVTPVQTKLTRAKVVE